MDTLRLYAIGLLPRPGLAGLLIAVRLAGRP